MLKIKINMYSNVCLILIAYGRQLLTLGSKPSAALSAVKKLVKCNKNSASASSAPVKETAC